MDPGPLRDTLTVAVGVATGASRQVCRCYWDRLAATVPYDRFVVLDRQIRKDPSAVPDDIAALAASCGATAGR